MRQPVPENVVVFVRFHKEIDEIIEKRAKEENKRKSSLVSEILSSYIFSPFPLSPSSSPFFLKRGRGREKKVGKGMNITLKKVVRNEIRIRGEREGMKESEMMTSILYSFLIKS